MSRPPRIFVRSSVVMASANLTWVLTPPVKSMPRLNPPWTRKLTMPARMSAPETMKAILRRPMKSKWVSVNICKSKPPCPIEASLRGRDEKVDRANRAQRAMPPANRAQRATPPAKPLAPTNRRARRPGLDGELLHVAAPHAVIENRPGHQDRGENACHDADGQRDRAAADGARGQDVEHAGGDERGDVG